MPSDDPAAAPMLSAASRDMLARVRHVVPPLLERFHKGQLGRIAVIGGSKDYTGAPYFSAMASARLGADMSHVICTPTAGAIIKTYSPNLMVHLLMRESSSSTSPSSSSPSESSDPTPASVAAPIIDMLPRLNALVIGPGLGRDPLMQATCGAVLAAARERRIPVVLDADALALVKTHTDTIRGWREVVLTPNVVEFGRLAAAVGVELGKESGKEAEDGTKKGEDCAAVSRALGGVCILQKGAVDYLSNGTQTWVCDLVGGRKRSGGQGDTLTGSIGTFLCWRKAYLDGLWETEGDYGEAELMMLAAWGGAAITRECSRLAFELRGRALQASDVGEMVPRSFEALIGEKEESKL